MKHLLTNRFKLLVASIMLVPLLALGVSYNLRADSEPNAVVAASNADELSCVSESSSVNVNQCVTWGGSGVNSKTVFIPIGLLAAEILVAFAVFQSVRRTDRMLLLTKVSVLMGIMLGSIVLLVAVNSVLLPRGQQGIYSADWEENGKKIGYTVRDNPTLGYGPEVIDVYMFVSLPPVAALIAGVAIAGATDQRRYAGMRKDALFQ